MKAILRSGFLALAIMALAVPANAGPYEEGDAAYQRDDSRFGPMPIAGDRRGRNPDSKSKAG